MKILNIYNNAPLYREGIILADSRIEQPLKSEYL